MKQVFDQLLKFLQQGISAIFHFVELIWMWSVDQISKLMAVPWQDWPLLKQVLLVVILAGVLWALYRAGWVAFGSRCGDPGCIRRPFWACSFKRYPPYF